MIEDHLAKLACLYEKTGKDWDLEISHSLTEPTLAAIFIRPEQSHMMRYGVCGPAIEDSVKRSADLVYREIILGEPIESEWPFTDPDDREFEASIKAGMTPAEAIRALGRAPEGDMPG